MEYKTHQDRDQAVYQLRIAHPDWGKRRMGYALGLRPNLVYLILKRMVKEGRLRINAQSRTVPSQHESAADYDEDAITSFYFGEGQRSKKVAARKFGLSHWLVAKALAQTGHPEESYQSLVEKLRRSGGQELSIPAPVLLHSDGAVLEALDKDIERMQGIAAVIREQQATIERLTGELGKKDELIQHVQRFAQSYLDDIAKAG